MGWTREGSCGFFSGRTFSTWGRGSSLGSVSGTASPELRLRESRNQVRKDTEGGFGRESHSWEGPAVWESLALGGTGRRAEWLQVREVGLHLELALGLRAALAGERQSLGERQT